MPSVKHTEITVTYTVLGHKGLHLLHLQKNITLKPALVFLHDSLTVSVRLTHAS